LGDHGVSNDIEIVAVDQTVSPGTTLFFWLLQYLGHEKVSIASEGLDGWSAAGNPVSMDDTVIAEPETPIDVAIHPATFTLDVRSDVRLGAADAPREYPFSRLWVVAAEEVPEGVPVESYIHVPWTSNLTKDGFLMPAGDLWSLYEQAEVQYFNEIICYSDDPAEATMTWFALRLLDFPRILIYLPEGGGL
jgi:thiosulfate/3-mercaptopyruvate sulfurtransferase